MSFAIPHVCHSIEVTMVLSSSLVFAGRMRQRALSLSSAAVATSSVAVAELAGRGRGVVATAHIPPGTTLHITTPMAQVLKTTSADVHCAECLAPAPSGTRFCCAACADAYERRGGSLLERADLTPLRKLHEAEGRKFPLLIAQLLASLLAEIKRTQQLPSSWAPLELCFAELHEEALPQVQREHAQLTRAFADAGLASEQTLELFLPLARYRRLLGAAQLNAFELTLSHGATASALLPGLASCFNHSCDPNVLLSCGDTHEVAFVSGAEATAPGRELCISYVDVEAPRAERRELLLHKYAFDCDCERCRRGG